MIWRGVVDRRNVPHSRISSKRPLRGSLLLAVLLMADASAVAETHWPQPSPPIVPGSPGYVEIPGAAVPRDPHHHYKALFHISKEAPNPAKPHPALHRVARQINGLKAAGVPQSGISFALIVHGKAVDALLTDAAYRAVYKSANPNLQLIAGLRDNGVKIYVCGQYMAKANLPRSNLAKGVEVAEAATLVIIRLSNDGYAVVEE